jgi:predicted RNA-binding Zn-ribbon protein involved in translation (DUF1610 family)
MVVSTGSENLRFCGSCGAPIDARRKGTKFCSPRCAKRAATGLPPAPKVHRYSIPLCHPGYCVEPCPKCAFPEADGGYCADCGWTRPLPGIPGGEILHLEGTCHGPTYGERAPRRTESRRTERAAA